MRDFTYKSPDFEQDTYVPVDIEGNPCYQPSVYDSVMYDESCDGDLIQCDMTQILLNQEKYRRLRASWDTETRRSHRPRCAA